MRISDWSSDVCSSDLQHLRPNARKCYPCVRYKTSPMSRVAHPCPTGEKLAATQLASSSYRLLQGVMSDRLASPRSKVQPKTKRPRLHKVILLNDDYTPREFVVRSEEHTSELQSLMRNSYAVFCLKKKKNRKH